MENKTLVNLYEILSESKFTLAFPLRANGKVYPPGTVMQREHDCVKAPMLVHVLDSEGNDFLMHSISQVYPITTTERFDFNSIAGSAKIGLRKQIGVTVTVSEDEVADLFCQMDSRQQAYFFNRCAEKSRGWIDTQLCMVSDEPSLTDDARIFMRKIGDFSSKAEKIEK